MMSVTSLLVSCARADAAQPNTAAEMIRPLQVILRFSIWRACKANKKSLNFACDAQGSHAMNLFAPPLSVKRSTLNVGRFLLLVLASSQATADDQRSASLAEQ